MNRDKIGTQTCYIHQCTHKGIKITNLTPLINDMRISAKDLPQLANLNRSCCHRVLEVQLELK